MSRFLNWRKEKGEIGKQREQKKLKPCIERKHKQYSSMADKTKQVQFDQIAP
jgi:hypothetical protein